jgi:hypothetical protein
MVDGVHGYTAGLRTNALPAVTTGLTDLDQVMFGVTNLAHRCTAVDRNSTHFSRWQSQRGEIALFSYELNTRTCGAGHLAACSSLEFNVVNHCSNWDVAKGKRIAHPNL